MSSLDISKDQKLQDQLVDRALNDLERLYKALDLSDGVKAREALVTIITDLVGIYGQASTKLAVDTFMRMRGQAGITSRYQPKLAPGVENAVIEGSVKWAVSTLFGDAYDEAVTLSKLKDLTTRHVLHQGRVSVAMNVTDRQSGSYAYARILGPGENCKFCLMLSSRGYSYKSAKSASSGFHDGCRCSVVAGFEGVEVEGYDPEALLEEYKKLQ